MIEGQGNKRSFRAVTMGDSSVGKTSIVNRFIRDRFNPVESNTVGAIYDSYTQVHNGRTVEVQIWDTAGQEQYRALSPVYFRSASAGILVFDLSNRRSFENLNEWITLFQRSSAEDALVFVVGNKVDLVETRQVPIDDARDWAREQNCSYFETSAQTGQGIAPLFNSISATLGSKGRTEALHTTKVERMVGEDVEDGCC
jgi:small GTP-binding protein